jgi:hypothetical protein
MHQIFSAVRLSSFLIFVFCIVTITMMVACSPQEPSSDKAKVVSSLTAQQQIEQMLSEQLNQAVAIHIEFQREYKGWTFWVGHPLNVDGSRIDISGTPFSVDYAEGFFDDVFTALSKKDAVAKGVDLVKFNYGSTDAAFISWAEEYNLPLCLFSQEQKCQ